MQINNVPEIFWLNEIIKYLSSKLIDTINHKVYRDGAFDQVRNTKKWGNKGDRSDDSGWNKSKLASINI